MNNNRNRWGNISVGLRGWEKISFFFRYGEKESVHEDIYRHGMRTLNRQKVPTAYDVIIYVPLGRRRAWGRILSVHTEF